MKIQINHTKIPSHIISKWQNIVNIMADILEVPSAIITRVEPREIEVLRSAETPNNPYHSCDKVKMPKYYFGKVVTRNKRLLVEFAPKNPE